ncbi:MAG: hypothetical protein TREMPRED_000280 [Tremellales sp. Tagirdzhanova-0007]|nr:MAG: hypothetical protein TREMPRED_000280 [Tremellales sp. Tagirdzhanova-0007]
MHKRQASHELPFSPRQRSRSSDPTESLGQRDVENGTEDAGQEPGLFESAFCNPSDTRRRYVQNEEENQTQNFEVQDELTSPRSPVGASIDSESEAGRSEELESQDETIGEEDEATREKLSDHEGESSGAESEVVFRNRDDSTSDESSQDVARKPKRRKRFGPEKRQMGLSDQTEGPEDSTSEEDDAADSSDSDGQVEHQMRQTRPTITLTREDAGGPTGAKTSVLLSNHDGSSSDSASGDLPARKPPQRPKVGGLRLMGSTTINYPTEDSYF